MKRPDPEMTCPTCGGVLLIDKTQSMGNHVVFSCVSCPYTEGLTEEGKPGEDCPWDRFYTLVKWDGRNPSAAVQWKGTNVCLDFHCSCGAQAHFDGYFCYAIQCAECGKIYAVHPEIKMIEMPKEMALAVTNTIQVLGGKGENNEG